MRESIMFRERYRFLLQIFIVFLIVAAIFFLAVRREIKKVGTVGFALDDSWIHATLARNLNNGHGFAINPDESLPISTSPAWTLLTAASILVFKDPIKAVLILAFICQVAAAFLIYTIILKMTRQSWLALFSVACLMLNPIVLWGFASGMEIPLTMMAVLLILAAHYLYPPESLTRKVVLPLFCALAAMSRPELFIIFPLVVADTWRYFMWRDSAYKRPKAWTIPAVQILVFSSAVLPYFIFNYHAIGHPLPTTFYAKVVIRNVGTNILADGKNLFGISKSFFNRPVKEEIAIGDILLKHNFVLFMLLPLGMLVFTRQFNNRICRRGWLLPLILIFLPLAMGFVAPSQYFTNYAHRYQSPFIPMVTIMGCLGLGFIREKVGQKVIPLLLVVVITLLYFQNFQRTLELFARDVDNTERLYVQMGKWVRDNLESDEVVAINDIGAFSYFSEHRIVDIMGLASPEIWPILYHRQGADRTRSILEYLRNRKIRYIIVSPNYMHYISENPTIFEPVKQWEARFDTRRKISPQILYRITWPKDSKKI